MIIDTSDFRNYRFEVVDNQVIIYGPFVGHQFNHKEKKWEEKSVVATKEHPIVHLTTNNTDERILKTHLHHLKGAKMVSSDTVPNWDEDPYGRRVQRGTINRQTWDLSGCFA